MLLIRFSISAIFFPSSVLIVGLSVKLFLCLIFALSAILSASAISALVILLAPLERSLDREERSTSRCSIFFFQCQFYFALLYPEFI